MDVITEPSGWTDRPHSLSRMRQKIWVLRNGRWPMCRRRSHHFIFWGRDEADTGTNRSLVTPEMLTQKYTTYHAGKDSLLGQQRGG